jgi:hypothetical protein
MQPVASFSVTIEVLGKTSTLFFCLDFLYSNVIYYNKNYAFFIHFHPIRKL